MEGKGENETRTEGVLNCLVWQSHPQMYPSASQKPKHFSINYREPDGVRTSETSGPLTYLLT